VPVYLKIDPEAVVYIKAILESYEEFAELRTLNPQTGEIVALALEGTVGYVRELIASMSTETGIGEMRIREIPPPEDLSGDWLLGEALLNR
jgi:Domain of unknown function (DUF4911)